jgi:hypothetical protein
MNVGAMYEARQELSYACELCDPLESKGLWPLKGGVSLREVLRHDLAKFCLYLSASDGKATGSEALFFKLALGYDMSIDEMIYHIKSDNIYSTDFESEVPLFVKTIKLIGETLSAAGMEMDELVKVFAHLYMKMGSTLIECDDEVTEQEKTDLNIYMNMVYDYIGADADRELYDGARTSSSVKGSGAVRSEVRNGKILQNLDFETMKYSGFGSKVVQGVALPDHAMIVTAKHTSGSCNFIVEYFDCEGNKSNAFVNEIGEYHGSTLFNNTKSEPGEGILQVEAGGRWELIFISFPNAVKLSGSSNMAGHGDVITPLFEGNGGPNVIKLTHRGRSNFIVDIYDEDGHCENIVNEIGFFSGEKVMKLQKNVRYFAIVQADGSWSIDLGRGDSQIRVSQVEG